MAQARFWTAQAILDQAAIECGLSAPGATVYASTDANVILLRALLNTAGLDLSTMYRWPYPITKEHTITVANPGDTGTYNLPDDWNGIVDETGFDRNTGYTLRPIGPDAWQWLKTGNVAAALRVDFRVDSDTLRVATVPANGTVLALEYHSRWWVKAAGQALPNKDTCTAATDVVYFDHLLVTSLLKLRFKTERGSDTSSALTEFERRWDAVTGRASGAEPIRIGGAPSDGLVTEDNLPPVLG